MPSFLHTRTSVVLCRLLLLDLFDLILRYSVKTFKIWCKNINFLLEISKSMGSIPSSQSVITFGVLLGACIILFRKLIWHPFNFSTSFLLSLDHDWELNNTEEMNNELWSNSVLSIVYAPNVTSCTMENILTTLALPFLTLSSTKSDIVPLLLIISPKYLALRSVVMDSPFTFNFGISVCFFALITM